MRAWPLYFFIIFFVYISAYPQMPEWIFFKDREGNTYFLDSNNKIYTPNKPQKRFTVVSALGLDYHLNHAIEIVKYHPVEGLTLLKSILVLPEINKRIKDAREKASEKINELKKRNGDRYTKWNQDASLLLVNHNDITSIIDDEMKFSIKLPYDVSIISHRERVHVRYKYSGLSIGIKIDKVKKDQNEPTRRYDMLLAIDSEIFPLKVHDLDQIEENWRNNLGHDDLKRKIMNVTKSRKIYEVSRPGKLSITGQEAIFVNGNIGYMLRIICPDELYHTYSKQISNIILSFTVM